MARGAHGELLLDLLKVTIPEHDHCTQDRRMLTIDVVAAQFFLPVAFLLSAVVEVNLRRLAESAASGFISAGRFCCAAQEMDDAPEYYNENDDLIKDP